MRVKRYSASIELVVDVVIDSEDELEGNAQAVEAINREVISPMPRAVIGAWVAYVESDEDLKGKKQ